METEAPEKVQTKNGDMVITSINIRRDQKAWVDEHDDINLSGLVRMALDVAMEDRA